MYPEYKGALEVVRTVFLKMTRIHSSHLTLLSECCLYFPKLTLTWLETWQPAAILAVYQTASDLLVKKS